MPKVMLTPRQCAEVLKALGDETRLRILESLLVQEKCVSDLVVEGRTQPHVSHHLGILRAAALIEGIREGKRVCYRVSPKLRQALKESRALDFGCCQISFPDAMLVAQARESHHHVDPQP